MTDTSPASESFSFRIERPSIDIFSQTAGSGSLLSLLKAVRDESAQSNTGTPVGARAHLIDKVAARTWRDLNATHSICLDAKRASSVGMGHRDQTIYDALDPLCRFGWQDILDAAGDDFVDHGEGFIEVVWDEGRTQILGLHQLDGADVHVVVEVENDSETIHYQVTSGTATRETVAMAAWGDLLNLRGRYGDKGGMVRNDLIGTRAGAISAPTGGRIVNSEVIHFRMATSRDPYMGYPDWVAATPAVELFQCLLRHQFDFHFNRGVPELLLTVIGGSMNAKDWEKIEAMFKQHQGLGNSHKSMALRIPGSPSEVTVQVDKLAMEGKQEDFSDKAGGLAMLIATAHGVPPLLANILLPGKIGAANEGPNALLLFQKRKLGQIQRTFSRTLANTLGSGVQLATPEGASKTLTAEQFLGAKFSKGDKDPMTGQAGTPKDETGAPIYVEPGNGFKTVLDGMTLGAQDTMARMKEPMAGSGRNPEDGLLDGASDRKKGDPKFTRS